MKVHFVFYDYSEKVVFFILDYNIKLRQNPLKNIDDVIGKNKFYNGSFSTILNKLSSPFDLHIPAP